MKFRFPNLSLYKNSEELVNWLKKNPLNETACLILIKGSRGMKMENITKELMAEPEKAEELLVN